MIRRVVNSIFSYILSYSGKKMIKVIGYFFLIIYNLVSESEKKKRKFESNKEYLLQGVWYSHKLR
jgi:hypothetical protein